MKFVRLCPICGSEAFTDSVICHECRKELDAEYFDSFMSRCPECLYPRVSDQYVCERCSSSLNYRLYPVARYDGKLSFSLVDSFKFHNKKELAPVVALYLSKALEKLDPNHESIIVPIPCSSARIHRFGWDQMEEVCRHLKWPYLKLLKRNDDLQIQQKRLSKSQRITAVRGRFSINEECPDMEVLKTRKIIVVDDIITTGSTMNAAISLLKESGFEDVSGASWLAEL